MRLHCVVVIGFLLVTGAPALAQSDLVAGSLNLRTGLFQPRLKGATPEAGTTYAGTFEVGFKITIVSSIPSGQAIGCSAVITGTDSTFSAHEEQATALATRSGATATCTITIPYAWALGATPTYNNSYSISTNAAAGTPSRQSSFYGETQAAVPANGSTTKVSENVTL